MPQFRTCRFPRSRRTRGAPAGKAMLGASVDPLAASGRLRV
jgi:hypothetical protein